MLLKRAKKQEEEAASAAAAAEEKKRQEEAEAASAAAATEEKKRQEEAAASKIGAFYRTAKQKKQEEAEAAAAAAAEAAKEKENKIVSALGENWQQSLNAARDKQIVTGATIITAIKNFLNDQNDDQALQTITTEGVNELTTFLSKIPPATGETPPTKFAEIVRAIESKLITFFGKEILDAGKHEFVVHLKINFNIENLKSDEGLNTLKNKCPKCIEYWKEMSKDNSKDLDIDKIFNLFIPEYNDFKKYVLTRVYELSHHSLKVVNIFKNSPFVFVCRLLDYMRSKPGTPHTNYLNLYKKLDLEPSAITINTKPYENSGETGLEQVMFELFKELLARGISSEEKEKIETIVGKTGDTIITHKSINYIILVSYKYLVFSKGVYYWSTFRSTMSREYYEYEYTNFLDKIEKRNYIEIANTDLAEKYYKDGSSHTHIKDHVLDINKSLENTVYDILYRLSQIHELNIKINSLLGTIRTKKGGKTMKHRIMKKRKTKRRPKKKPLTV